MLYMYGWKFLLHKQREEATQNRVEQREKELEELEKTYKEDMHCKYVWVWKSSNL